MKDAELPPGSGDFGRWTADEFGLPAYAYGAADPRPWHQVGNDRITAVVHAGGDAELFTWETGAKWLNGPGRGPSGPRIVPAAPAAPPSAGPVLFGPGYVRREMSAGGLGWRETLYAPFGDFPLVVLRADVSAPEAAEWVAEWTPRQVV